MVYVGGAWKWNVCFTYIIGSYVSAIIRPDKSR